MSDALIPLADAIRALRTELIEAVKEGEEKDLRFELGPVEMEFNAIVSREGSGGGKIGFKLFGQGAEVNLGGKVSDQQVQRLKLVLTPRSPGGTVETGKLLVGTTIKRPRAGD